MKPWEWKWFQKFVEWCRRWQWFDTYIYGKSTNLEDFVRNPAEVLRDNCFPFVIKNVKAISLMNLRLFYKHYHIDQVGNYLEDGKNDGFDLNAGTYWLVPMGEKRKLVLKFRNWTVLDFRVWNDFWTKFCNAILFLQIVLSIKWFFPIPYVAFCLRFTKKTYFQFGFGYSPQLNESKGFNTILTAKLRIASHKEEAAWNPGDVYGFWEGTI